MSSSHLSAHRCVCAHTENAIACTHLMAHKMHDKIELDIEIDNDRMNRTRAMRAVNLMTTKRPSSEKGKLCRPEKNTQKKNTHSKQIDTLDWYNWFIKCSLTLTASRLLNFSCFLFLFLFPTWSSPQNSPARVNCTFVRLLLFFQLKRREPHSNAPTQLSPFLSLSLCFFQLNWNDDQCSQNNYTLKKKIHFN